MTEVKLLRLSDKTIEIELIGEDHTMANLIAKYAIKTPGVTYASYTISHPLVSNPVIVITTDGSKKPIDVLEEVLKKIRSDLGELRKAVVKALESS